MQNLCNLFLIVLLATACKPSKKAKPQSAKKPVTQAEQTPQPSSNEGFEDALKDARSKSSDPNSEHDKLQSAVDEYKNSDTYKNPKNAGQKGFNAMVDSVGDLSKQNYKDLDCSNVKGNMDNIGTMENIASAQAKLENNYKKPKNPRVATSPAFYVGMSLITLAGVGAISGIPSLMEEVKTLRGETEPLLDQPEVSPNTKKEKIVESLKKLHTSELRSRFIQLGIAPLLITGISMVVTRNQDDWFPYYKGLLVSYGITGIILGLVYTIKDVRAAKKEMIVANEELLKEENVSQEKINEQNSISKIVSGNSNDLTQKILDSTPELNIAKDNLNKTQQKISLSNDVQDNRITRHTEDAKEESESERKVQGQTKQQNTTSNENDSNQQILGQNTPDEDREETKEDKDIEQIDKRLGVTREETSAWREKAEQAKAGIGVMLSGVAALSISAALGLASDDPSVKVIKATNRALAACVAKSEAQAKKK